MISAFLQALKSQDFAGMMAHHHVIPASPAEFRSPSPALSPSLSQALKNLGISNLYSHQTETLQLVREGKNPVIVTPTASGKTLSYLLPILEDFLSDNESRALFLFPLKALEQDQLKQFQSLTKGLGSSANLDAVIYDGDTPATTRAKIRYNFPRVLITNPEMLHLALSGYHQSWEKFFRSLKYLVIDELHTYKGIFGSHMAQIFRRIDRICRYYRAHPQIIACSATIANPVELAENLIGKPFVLVEKSGAPTAQRHYIFLNPEELSVYTVASKIFRLGLQNGLKTIAFTKARRITELMHQWLLDSDSTLKNRISAYRAGFLPQERRLIEAKLNSGELAGVISTSALEMGIDIGYLDLCILVGYPGSVSITFQRGGRVGRKSESAVVMIGQQNALDQYFMSHPEEFFQRSFESAVVDKNNRHILKKHLLCAADEIPLTDHDPYYPTQKYGALFKQLEREGALEKSPDGTRWFTTKAKPQRDIDLRATGGAYTIVDEKGKLIGTIGSGNVFSECHPGAVYLHRGAHFLVTNLDLTNHNVTVGSGRVDYYTVARSQKDTQVISEIKSRQFKNFSLHFGELKVTEWITGYEKRHLFTQELQGVFPLQLPEQSYDTVGLWMKIPRDARTFCENQSLHYMGGIHGLEHAVLSLVPLFALCDRGDMGGISFVEHPGIKGSAVFFYDGYPGGVGLASRIFEVFPELLKRTYDLIRDCKCSDGCPSCIHSPRCGSGNHPLDKKAVRELLQRFEGEGDFKVKEEKAPLEQVISKPSLIVRPRPRPDFTGTLVFDLETKLSPDEVGGWKNIPDMLMAVGVVMEVHSRKYRIFYEEEAERLISVLKKAELVVGFNLNRFDYKVLSHYGLKSPAEIRTLDLLDEVVNALGFRLKLDNLCQATLNTPKSASGEKSLEWVKAGKLDLVTEYCQMDVKLTRDLYLFGKENGYVFYQDKQAGKKKLQVNW